MADKYSWMKDLTEEELNELINPKFKKTGGGRNQGSQGPGSWDKFVAKRKREGEAFRHKHEAGVQQMRQSWMGTKDPLKNLGSAALEGLQMKQDTENLIREGNIKALKNLIPPPSDRPPTKQQLMRQRITENTQYVNAVKNRLKGLKDIENNKLNTAKTGKELTPRDGSNVQPQSLQSRQIGDEKQIRQEMVKPRQETSYLREWTTDDNVWDQGKKVEGSEMKIDRKDISQQERDANAAALQDQADNKKFNQKTDQKAKAAANKLTAAQGITIAKTLVSLMDKDKGSAQRGIPQTANMAASVSTPSGFVDDEFLKLRQSIIGSN